jgi:hypothetical protein
MRPGRQPRQYFWVRTDSWGEGRSHRRTEAMIFGTGEIFVRAPAS